MAKAQTKATKTSKKPIFLGKRLLFITAHPDDETFSSAGTIALNDAAGGKTWVVCATSGEKGSSKLAKPLSETALKKIREKELKTVGELVGIHKIFFLRLPDTMLNKHTAEFYENALAIANQFMPDYIFSFGPDGLSGHLDHIAAHKVSKRIAQKIGAGLVNFAVGPTFGTQDRKRLLARRAKGVYTKEVKPLKANCTVPVDFNLEMKAISMHHSQFAGSKPLGAMAKNLLRARFSQDTFYVYPQKGNGKSKVKVKSKAKK